MNFKNIIEKKENESPKARHRRLVAAVITQTFSYIIKMRLKYKYVCTGEAFVFLRVSDNPITIYYYFSVFKGNVKKTTE